MVIQAPEALSATAQRLLGGAYSACTIPVRKDLMEATACGERPKLKGGAIARVSACEVLVVAMNGESRSAFLGAIIITHLLANGSVSVV